MTGLTTARWLSGNVEEAVISPSMCMSTTNILVLQGRYTVIIQSKEIPVSTGQEYFIPKGLPHAGAFVAGTRTIHAFGGRRAERIVRGEMDKNV
jgi:hypothetical protein